MSVGHKAKKDLYRFENLLALGLVGVLLVFNQNFDDAMNLPKFALFSFIVVPSLILYFPRKEDLKRFKIAGLFLLSYSVLIFTSSLLSGSFKLSLIGNHARYNGLFFYLLIATTSFIIISRFQFSKFDNFLTIIQCGLFIFILYCFLQYLGLDFVDWNISFNPIVGTLGNSNFSAAFLGFSVNIFLHSGINESKFFLRYFYYFVSVLSFFLAIKTQTIQGPVLAILGILIMATFKYARTLKSLLLFALVLFLASTPFVFGLIGKGPFSRFLHVESVIFRGDYWRAGFEMFAKNPLFGVGFGQYGYEFTKYRDLAQVLRRGAKVTTDQPHNVFLDYLATGGFFTFLIYFVLVLLVIVLGIQSLFTAKNTKDKNRTIVVLTIFILYAVQSIVSIDQLAIAFLGWVFGSLVIGNWFYLNSTSEVGGTKTSKVNIIGTTALVVMVSFLLVPSLKADLAVKLPNLYNPASELDSKIIVEKAVETYNAKSLDPYYSQQAGIALLRLGKIQESMKVLDMSIRSNPKDSLSNAILASLYWQQKKCERSLTYSGKSTFRDPLNQIYLLDRARCLAETGQMEQANKYVQEILKIDSKSEAALQSGDLLRR